MSLPISKAFLPLSLALAACGGDSDIRQKEEVSSAEDKIECALAGSTAFERACTTEQIAGEGVTMLVIRHPDGGFRRFDILTDGRGLAPADGFDETEINLLGNGMIEVSSGDDRYRLPAQIKGQDVPAPELTTKDDG